MPPLHPSKIVPKVPGIHHKPDIGSTLQPEVTARVNVREVWNGRRMVEVEAAQVRERPFNSALAAGDISGKAEQNGLHRAHRKDSRVLQSHILLILAGDKVEDYRRDQRFRDRMH